MTISLFDPVRFGAIAASSRIVMAPLTRDRAGPGQVPTAMMVEYYTQRASAGMIVSEGTQISAEGQGYLDTPGIYSDQQIAGWKRVTDSVHAKGGKIVVQLWHVGRIGHVSLLPAGMQPVSSTARPAKAKTYTAKGFENVSEPRALGSDEIPRLIADFRQSARNAVAAGFDGVEVHSANGYLLEQFVRDSINDRQDAYGGSVENRTRLVVEVMSAIADEIGAGRTGIRLSPVTPANDAAQDSDAQATYNRLVERLAPLKLAFLHIVEERPGGRAMRLPSISRRSASVSRRATRKVPGSSTTATTGRWRSTPWRAARPIWSPSASPTSATRTWSSVCASTRRSPSRRRRPSTAATGRATSTTRRSPRQAPDRCNRVRRWRPIP